MSNFNDDAAKRSARRVAQAGREARKRREDEQRKTAEVARTLSADIHPLDLIAAVQRRYGFTPTTHDAATALNTRRNNA